MRSILERFTQWRRARQVRLVTLEGACRRAARGSAYLDAAHPGWYRQVDPDTLELAHGTCCVLGQLHGEFRLGLSRSALVNTSSAPRASLSPVACGFLCVQGVSDELQELDYDHLNRAWRGEVLRRCRRDRRQAARLLRRSAVPRRPHRAAPASAAAEML